MSDREEPPDAAKDSEAPSILAKAFDILGAFNDRHRVLTLTQISRRSQLPKSSVHRLLRRLGALGVIEEHGNGYRLGIRLLQLVGAMPVDSMRELALPHMARLQAWSKESVHFGVLRGGEVVIVQALFSPQHLHPVGTPGTRIPAHLSALGRSMLAYLPDDEVGPLLSGTLLGLTSRSKTDPQAIRAELVAVRVTGAAVQKDEVLLGMGNIAAPILIKGRPMAAVAVQFASSKPVLEATVDAVKLTAQRITRDTVELLASHNELFPYDY